MKASELINTVTDFRDNYLYSDVNSEVRLGCDCGCGGDSYTIESWTEMVKESEEAKDAFMELCSKLKIEWDY